jgi:hypothetical protein
MSQWCSRLLHNHPINRHLHGCNRPPRHWPVIVIGWQPRSISIMIIHLPPHIVSSIQAAVHSGRYALRDLCGTATQSGWEPFSLFWSLTTFPDLTPGMSSRRSWPRIRRHECSRSAGWTGTYPESVRWARMRPERSARPVAAPTPRRTPGFGTSWSSGPVRRG